MKLTVFFLLVVFSVTYAFAPVARTSTTASTTSTTTTRLWSSAGDNNEPTMDINKLNRAVECAEHYGRCPVDELLELADGMYMYVYIYMCVCICL